MMLFNFECRLYNAMRNSNRFLICSEEKSKISAIET